MSDVFTKRRPMIDLDEFERRLCPPCSTDQKDGDPLAELLRIIGDKDESHETDFEPKTQLAARARQDAGELGELKQPDAHVRLIGGDFAAIEAGLLEAAIPSEAERSKGRNQHVVPRDGGWAVKPEGGQRASGFIGARSRTRRKSTPASTRRSSSQN
jgi:Uncharacterized protein conserved in bacteria (DUF2188)